MPVSATRQPQTARAISRSLKRLADPKRAEVSAWFFRTGPGEYGEGDRFLGIAVPRLRREAKTLGQLPMSEIRTLLFSRWHEERLLALLVLVDCYERGDEKEHGLIFRFYLANTGRVNNWDLVDVSAPPIVGEHLANRDKSLLKRLARSSNLWERRIAIIATLAFIGHGDLRPTFELAEQLREDPHDLIHKATGWALREAGKRNPAELRAFLARHAPRMPRTMLRYAIERFPQGERRAWLARKRESPRYRPQQK